MSSTYFCTKFVLGFVQKITVLDFACCTILMQCPCLYWQANRYEAANLRAVEALQKVNYPLKISIHNACSKSFTNVVFNAAIFLPPSILRRFLTPSLAWYTEDVVVKCKFRKP